MQLVEACFKQCCVTAYYDLTQVKIYIDITIFFFLTNQINPLIRSLVIRYSVPKGTGHYYLLLYSHFGVPTARQHGCLLYHIPKGMFHQFSLSISCPTNQKNLLIRKNIAAKQRIGKFIHKIAFCLRNIWIVLQFAITLRCL